MATETLYPDGSVFTLTGLSGAYTDVDEDPSGPDANWLTAPGSNTNTEVRASFPTPTGDPTTGAGLQTFRVVVRKTAQSTNPSAVVELWETGGGAALATVVASTPISSTTGQMLTGTFDASLLSTANGSAVEIRVVGSTGGGTPANRASVEVGAIAWDVTYTAGVVSVTPDPLTQSQTLDQPTLTQHNVLTPDSLTQSQTLDQPTLNPGFAGQATLAEVTVDGLAGTFPQESSVGAANANPSLNVDTNYRFRFRIENAGVDDTDSFKLQYKHTQGTNTWTDITSSSSVVKAIDTPYFINADDVPEYIGGSGTYQSDNNAAIDTTGAFTLGAILAASDAIEGELSFQIVGTDVSNSDTIQLRAVRGDGTALETYTNTPTITVSTGAYSFAGQATLAEVDIYSEAAGFEPDAYGLLDGVIDPNGDPVSWEITQQPARGTLVVYAGGKYTYTPDPGKFGSDYFLWKPWGGGVAGAETQVDLYIAGDLQAQLASVDVEGLAGSVFGTLNTNSLTQSQTLEQPTLTQHNVLVPDSLTQSQTLEQPTVSPVVGSGLIKSFRMQASGDGGKLTTNLPAAATTFTMCGWFRIISDRTGNYRFLLSVENAGGSSWKTFGWSGSTENFYISRNGAVGSDGVDPPKDGSWFFAFFRGNGTILEGKWLLPGSNTWTAVPTVTVGTNFTPGQLSWGTTTADEYINGDCVYPRAWDSALTDAQLLQVMRSTDPQITANLLHASKDDGVDTSGAGADMTVSNSQGGNTHPFPFVAQTKAYDSNVSDTTMPVTLDDPTTPGNALIAIAWVYLPSARYITAFDSASDTGSVVDSTVGVNKFALAKIENLTGGETDYTLTLDAANQYRRGWLFEIAGVPAADVIDDFDIQAGTTWPTTTDGISTSGLAATLPNALIIGAAWNQISQTQVMSAGTGFTAIGTQSNASGDNSLWEYKKLVNAGASEVTFTDAIGGQTVHVGGVILKDPTAAAGASPSVTPDSLSESQTLDQPTLTEAGVLTPDSLTESQTLDQPALTEHAALTPDDLTESQTIDQPVLIGGLDAVLVGPGLVVGGGGSTVTSAAGATAASESTFVVVTSGDSGYTISSVTDNKGNTYVQQSDYFNASGNRTAVWVCENGVGGAGHTASATWSGNAYGIRIALVEVIAPSGYYPKLDVAQGVAAGSPPWALATGTLAQAPEVIVTGLGVDAGSLTSLATSDSTALYTTLGHSADGSDFPMIVSKAFAGTTAGATVTMTGNAGLHANEGQVTFYAQSTGTTSVTPDDLTEGQTLDQPALTEHNVLTPDSLSEGQSLDQPTLTEHNVLAPDSLTESQTLDGPTLTEHAALTPDALTENQTVDQPTLLPSGSLAPDPLVEGQTFEQPTLTQHGALTPDSLVEDQSLDQPALTQHGTLTPDALQESQSVSEPVLTEHAALTPDPLDEAQTLAEPVLDQHNALTPDALTEEQAISQPSLSVGGSLPVDDLQQSDTLEQPTLTQHSGVTPDGLTEGQTLDQSTLTEHASLKPNDLDEGQSLSQPTLLAGGGLAADPLTQNQSLDAPTLLQHATLTPNGLVQLQSLEATTLLPSYILNVAGMTQSQIMDSPTLLASYLLAVADLLQAQTLESATAIDPNLLPVNDMLQSQSLENLLLTIKQVGFLTGELVTYEALVARLETLTGLSIKDFNL